MSINIYRENLKQKQNISLQTNYSAVHCKNLIVGVSSTSRTKTKYEYYSCNKFIKNFVIRKMFQRTL